MQKRIYNLLKFLIGWPLAIVALFFIGKLIAPQFPTLLVNIHYLNWTFLSIGVVLFILFSFTRGVMWHLLLRFSGHTTINYNESCALWGISELKRYVPGSIWSFVGRAAAFAEKGIPKKDSVRFLLFEAELLVIGGTIVSLLSLPFLLTYAYITSIIASSILWLVVGGVLLYTLHRKFKLGNFILPSFNPSELLLLVLVSSISYFFFGLAHYFVITSYISLDPNLIWQIAGISVFAFLIGYLSLLTPAGFGVREGILVIGLSKIMSVSAAGFVTLFSRIILILSELLFVILAYAFYKIKNTAFLRTQTFVGKNKQLTILSITSLIYTIYFTVVSSLRFENFYTGKFDLGNMAQTVWNTTQGRFFAFTHPDTAEFVSRLSTHADFILVLLAPFYALWPDPRNLLFIQSAVIALGALFVFFIAKEVLKNKNVALVLGLAYLINPSVQRANLYDFHAVVLATTFLLGAYYFLIKKRYWYFLLFAILAGITKEQVWLIVSLFGLLLFFQYKKRFFGSLLFIGCILLSYYLISHAIPQALGSNQHFALEYYSNFGSSPLDIVKNILFSPAQTLQTVLEQDKVNYLKQLFYPLGYLSLFAPWFLIFAGPDLTINLLSNNTQLHQIYYQYTATITPFLFIGAIYGVSLIKQFIVTVQEKRNLSIIRESTINTVIIIYVLIVSLYGAYLYGPLPGSKEPNLDMITKPANDKTFILQTLSQIPTNASVASSNNLGAQLSNRQYLYIMPFGMEKAEYVVFYLNTSQQSEMYKKDVELLEKLKQDPRYEIMAQKGIFVVFKKISY